MSKLVWELQSTFTYIYNLFQFSETFLSLEILLLSLQFRPNKNLSLI